MRQSMSVFKGQWDLSNYRKKNEIKFMLFHIEISNAFNFVIESQTVNISNRF